MAPKKEDEKSPFKFKPAPRGAKARAKKAMEEIEKTVYGPVPSDGDLPQQPPVDASSTEMAPKKGDEKSPFKFKPVPRGAKARAKKAMEGIEKTVYGSVSPDDDLPQQPPSTGSTVQEALEEKPQTPQLPNFPDDNLDGSIKLAIHNVHSRQLNGLVEKMKQDQKIVQELAQQLKAATLTAQSTAQAIENLMKTWEHQWASEH